MKKGDKAGVFRVDRRIGAGGAGEVFRAVHERTGLPVALKVLHQLDDASLSPFRREAEDQAALAHPGVVYLFDYGMVSADGEERPFLAMELASCTLADLLPLPSWSAIRNVLRQILDALAYVHARGVVHRDLKPENILVFPDADGRLRLKLSDFGLAGLSHLATEQSRPERSDTGFAGTPHYMAPEQLRERWRRYGPATDLYALGCLAYKLVCGRTPFSGSVMELVLKHLTMERPPLEPQMEVPEGVEAWVHRLMERDLLLRFGRACEAAAQLPGAKDDGVESLSQSAPTQPAIGDGISLGPTISLSEEVTRIFAAALPAPGDAEAGPSERSAAPPIPVVEQVPRWQAEDVKIPLPLLDTGIGLFALRGLPLVGREHERDLLWGELRRVLERRETRVVVLSGYAGVGKSRVAQWLTQRIHELVPAEIFVALHAAEEAVGEGFVGLFRRHFKTGELRRDEAYDRLREELSEEVARGVTEVLYPTDGLSAQEILGPRMVFKSPSERYRLIEEALLDTSGHRLPVLWIDDLQWAQDGRAMVKYLLRQEYQGPPVLVVTTLREDLRDGALERELQELLADQRVQEYQLRSLSAAEQREFARRNLPVSEELLDLLVERTEGNPLFARQLLSEWIQSGSLIAGDDGFEVARGQELLLPDALQELWISRSRRALGGSPDQEEALFESLMLAAVLGRDVVYQEWRVVCEALGCPLPRGQVDGLVTAGLVRRADQGFSFSHGLLAEALKGEAQRRGRLESYHRICGESLEELLLRPGSSAGFAAPRLAYHWLAAGDLRRALKALDQCVEFYRGRSENKILRQLYEERRDVMGRLGMGPGDRSWIANDLLHLRSRRAEYVEEEILGQLEVMLGRAEGAGDPGLISDVWSAFGEVHTAYGRLTESLEAFGLAYGFAEEAGDLHQRAMIGIRVGWAKYRKGDLGEAEEHFEESAAALESLDRHSYLWAGTFVGWIKVTRGEHDEAGEIFRRSLQCAREEGYSGLEVHCVLGFADIRRYQAKFSEARVLYKEAGRLHRLQGNRQGEMICWLNAATLEVESGDVGLAEQELRRARELFCSERDRGTVPWIRAIELAMAALQGQQERCAELLAELWQLNEQGFAVSRDLLRLIEIAEGQRSQVGPLREVLAVRLKK